MELQFQKTTVPCLKQRVHEVRNAEQTQELRLSDGMPDIGRVLASWGQPILRGKEWHRDSIGISGGMMVWVLYAPEDGTAPRCIESWIPIQMQWEMDDGDREGDIRIRCLNRFVDARSVSPRKIMLRTGLAAMAEAYVPGAEMAYIPENVPEDVQLLRANYPVRLPREAGEKSFLLDEELTLPGSIPTPEKIVYFCLRPEITDQKVMANKVVFRGSGNLHMLYLSENGQLHSWDFPLQFSQFAELNGDYGADARADIALCPTSLELDLNEEGGIRLKCGMVGQYLIDDMQMLELVEDAYSPRREVEVQREELTLPAILDTRRENITAEQTVNVPADMAVDVSFLPDFPRQRRTENGVSMELPGMFQLLYYGEDSALQSSTARWEGNLEVNAGEDGRVSGVPVLNGEPLAVLGADSVQLRSELPVQMTTVSGAGIPMVTGLTLGEQREPDASRPALILRRAGKQRLWDIAKQSGSTMEAIRSANDLQEEPAPNQMLLIPVP